MIEQEYIDRIFNSLTKMDVELDPNPIEFGPSSLNEKTAKVRLFLSKTEKIFIRFFTRDSNSYGGTTFG